MNITIFTFCIALCIVVCMTFFITYFTNKRNSVIKYTTLKNHIADLSKRHLDLTRQVNRHGDYRNVDYRNVDYRNPEYQGGEYHRAEIPYQRGLDTPIKFYTPVENTYTNRWQKVGVVLSVSPTDDTVYNLEQRSVFPYTDDNFEYRIYDTYKNIHINIPSQTGKKIYNKDTFIIPGRESIGLFEVVRDTDYLMVPI